AEGVGRGGEPGRALGRDEALAEPVLELVHGQRRGVEDSVGDLTEIRERPALGPDSVERVALAGQRMAPPRLVVAPHQRFLARLQEEHLHLVAPRPQLPDRVEQAREVGALPHIDAECHPMDRLLGAHDQVGERRDQGRGEVVDAEESHVLEALDRVALAGAAEAGDDHEGQRPGHRTRYRLRGASRRWCEGKMPSSSRYLATVRRAIVRPRFCSACATSWSDCGFAGSSAARRSWIIFLTETDDTISPSPDAIPLWKKNLSSNSPCGVSTYLLVVTRLIVDSCMPMSSPTSRRDRGLRCGRPRS